VSVYPKTLGTGLVSVVSQNVLTLAGNKAIQDANFRYVNGLSAKVELKGFVDEQTNGFI